MPASTTAPSQTPRGLVSSATADLRRGLGSSVTAKLQPPNLRRGVVSSVAGEVWVSCTAPDEFRPQLLASSISLGHIFSFDTNFGLCLCFLRFSPVVKDTPLSSTCQTTCIIYHLRSPWPPWSPSFHSDRQKVFGQSVLLLTFLFKHSNPSQVPEVPAATKGQYVLLKAAAAVFIIIIIEGEQLWYFLGFSFTSTGFSARGTYIG